MAFLAGERRRQEGSRDFLGQRGSHDAGPETQDVHVVVLNSLVGSVCIVAHGGSDAWNLVGGNQHASAAAAHQQAPLGPTVGEAGGHRLSRVRVVDRCGQMGAEIENLVPRRATTSSFFMSNPA